MKKYNLALLPLSKAELYANLAKKYFAKKANGYLLGAHSMPHITLCQFLAEQTSIPFLIQEITKKPMKNLFISFNGLHLTNEDEGPFWYASLSIERTSALLSLLQEMVDLLSRYNLKPLNPTHDLYRPHLTLARIDKISVTGFPKETDHENEFFLGLGKCDSLGQFTKLIYHF